MIDFLIGFALGLCLGIFFAVLIWRQSRQKIEELQALLRTPLGDLVPRRKRGH